MVVAGLTLPLSSCLDDETYFRFLGLQSQHEQRLVDGCQNALNTARREKYGVDALGHELALVVLGRETSTYVEEKHILRGTYEVRLGTDTIGEGQYLCSVTLPDAFVTTFTEDPRWIESIGSSTTPARQ